MDILFYTVKTISNLVMRIVYSFSGLLLFLGFYLKNPSTPQSQNRVPNFLVNTSNQKRDSKTNLLLLYSQKFNTVNSKVRDGKIAEPEAKKEVADLLALIKRYYLSTKKSKSPDTKVFPVPGYNYKAIGGTKGNGYLPAGYNYYQGNKHQGHPAHDIFVHDKNQDCFDDKTGKPIPIVSASNGIVVATATDWHPACQLRGGNYIWIYSPEEELLYYYAHNKEVLVQVGDLVKSGQKIATMGRSGLNAYKKRSPTHLHFMTLKVLPNGELIPVNPYQTLYKS